MTDLDYVGDTYYTIRNLSLYECQGWCREEPECQASSFSFAVNPLSATGKQETVCLLQNATQANNPAAKPTKATSQYYMVKMSIRSGRQRRYSASLYTVKDKRSCSVQPGGKCLPMHVFHVNFLSIRDKLLPQVLNQRYHHWGIPKLRIGLVRHPKVCTCTWFSVIFRINNMAGVGEVAVAVVGGLLKHGSEEEGEGRGRKEEAKSVVQTVKQLDPERDRPS